MSGANIFQETCTNTASSRTAARIFAVVIALTPERPALGIYVVVIGIGHGLLLL